MDMNWTDEIRDPEPLKRPIYNAADYDTRHGDPPSRTNPVKPITGWRPALYVISSMDPSRFSPRTGTRWEATR